MIKRDESGKFVSTKEEPIKTAEIKKEVSALNYEDEIKATEAKLAALKKAQAEKAEAEKKALADAKNSERKLDLVKVQDAANAYLDQVIANQKTKKQLADSEAVLYEAYRKELDAFANKHKNYHLSYTVNGDNVEFKIEEARANSFEDIIKEQNEMFKKLWNNFWF